MIRIRHRAASANGVSGSSQCFRLAVCVLAWGILCWGCLSVCLEANRGGGHLHQVPLPRRPDSAHDEPTFSVLFFDRFLVAFWIDFGSILRACGRPFCFQKSSKKMIEFLEGFWKHFGLIIQRIFLQLWHLF